MAIVMDNQKANGIRLMILSDCFNNRINESTIMVGVSERHIGGQFTVVIDKAAIKNQELDCIKNKIRQLKMRLDIHESKDMKSLIIDEK